MINFAKTIQDKSSLIGRAYDFSKTAHANQKRVSGESYFSHPVAVAEYLAKAGMDEVTVTAGLLHDVIEDTPETPEEIERKFGSDVRFLVEGVTKLGHVKYRGEAEQVNNIRRMILAMAEDIRVILIKLADRRHNMLTLSALPPQKQKRVAEETAEIYAPLAYRLGMQNLSGELEDLAFPYTHPEEYRWLIEHVRDRYEDRDKYLRSIRPKVERALREAGIKPIQIDFRAKRYASLYKKLQRYGTDLDKIYDLVAFRIIVSSIGECYETLGIIHKIWPPVPGRIKDYIATPKPNGYRSLHTTVIADEGRFVEFQIRTQEMHDQAENGIAAHWAYDQTKGKNEKRTSFADAKELRWVQQLRSWQGEFTDPKEFMESLKIDFFKDRIFVITPRGEVIDLPRGATPVDFAYMIHTDLGNQCSGAKVNGKIVPLDYKLQSQDIVEIITQKGKKPSPSWLNFVVGGFTKKKIRAALKERRGGMLQENPKSELKIVVEEGIGIYKDITATISRSHINILQIQSNKEKGGRFSTMKIICDTADRDKMSKLVLKLKKIRQIKEIEHRPV
ncbi:RelA/SpoT family protein [Patescibacteria group bacterium]|nr:RelA/SpoT family protein [Patescibacteria group bacterium]